MATAQLDRSNKLKGKRMAVGIDAAVEDKALLHDAIQRVQSSVAPLWPLADYVAVNPFFGWVEQPFLQARERIRESRSCELLPGIVHYRNLYHRGAFKQEDLVAALDRCQREYPDWFGHVDLEHVESWLTDREDTTLHDWERHDQGRRYWSVAENIDEQADTRWNEVIVGEVTKFCAAHYDQGQAMWESSWRSLPLFQAWKNWGASRPKI